MDVPHIIAGRFRIECELGTGGMGAVYRAMHLGLERPVAVKIIKPEFAANSEVTDRFMREARTMARLHHPHAAMIFDAGNLPDGRHFIVMEFVEGITLAETLQRENRFTPERAVRIAATICDVLAEAHKLGIVHRDLKPSNIMMGERGVCVLDFGVAKVLATSAEATVTHSTTGSGVIIGTPRYMSPEQCLGHRVEARSDLYSLGVLLYEMLAGRPPFVDLLSSAVLIKQATAPPPSLLSLREDVPRSLALAVHTLLAKQPEHRPKTATAARAMLEKSLAPPVSTAVPEVQPFASTVATLNTRRPIILRVFAPVAVLVLCGALFLMRGRNEHVAFATSTPNDATTANARHDGDSHNAVASDYASYAANSTAPLSSLPSLDEARRIITAASHDQVSDVRVVRTPRDAALVAIHNERREGTSHLFVMERRGGSGSDYYVTSRAPLDAPDFRGAEWTAENFDADGDGYTEVLYTGTNARGLAKAYRLALYVPRTRQIYALRIAADATRGSRSWRASWSPNATMHAAAAYRTALQQRARAIIAAR